MFSLKNSIPKKGTHAGEQKNSHNKRTHQRVQVPFTSDCSLVTSTTARARHFDAVTKDIGLGGARLICDGAVALHTMLRVNFNFIDMVLTVSARVAWCEEKAKQARHVVGVQFVQADDHTRKILADFIGKTHCA